jgi:hypothetical protein
MSTVDLNRARQALAELDRLADENPDRLGDGPAWSDNQEQLEDAMGTPAKQRLAQYRERMRSAGYAPMSVYLQEEARDRLKRLSEERGESYGDVIAAALSALEG